MSEKPIKSVGLGGDGDEIIAIVDVESIFGVKLDYADAPHWRTAGDVFASLQKALPNDDRNRPDLWNRFAAALCAETGVNPDEIQSSSPLLSDTRIWAWLADVSAIVWIVAMAAAVVIALLTAVL